MISIHIEGQTPEEIRGILAGLASNYAPPALPTAAEVAAEFDAAEKRSKARKAAALAPAVSTTTSLPIPDGVVTASSAADPVPDPALTPATLMPPAAPAHTRESIIAAIKGAGWDKPTLTAFFAKNGVGKISEVPDGQLQAFGDAVAAAVKPAEATPAPASPAAPAAEAPSSGAKKYERADLTKFGADMMAWNRPAFVALLEKHGTKKLGSLADDKVQAFGADLEKLHAESQPKAAA